jgi:hypothetical protein
MGPNQIGRLPQSNQTNTALRWSDNAPTFTRTQFNVIAPKAESENIQTLTTDTTNNCYKHHNNNTINTPKALPIDQIIQADLLVPTARTTTLKMFNAIVVKIFDTSLKNVA